MTLSIGMLRAWAAPSAPSNNTHFACGSSPASSSNQDTGIPVYCEHDNKPWVCCTVFDFTASQSVSVFPEHSKKWNFETDGYRMRLSMLYIIGCLTMP